MSPQIRTAFRVIAIIGLITLTGSLVGAVLGQLVLGLNPIGQTLAAVLFVCGGIWALLLLVGMILTAHGGMGEYFWLWSPFVAAATLSIRLMATANTDFFSVIAFSTLVSLGVYGAAASIHILIRRLFARRETARQ